MKRALALALLAAPLARAEAPAALQPLHDVDITYKVPVPGGADMALLQRFRYSVSLHRQRVDLPTSGQWAILDFATRRMFVVHDESREVIEAPAPDAVAAKGAGYARVGTDTVAGMPCIDWRTRDLSGRETVTCYTNDGLLLRARSGDRVLMEAIAIKNDRQAPSVFDVPASYTHTRP